MKKILLLVLICSVSGQLLLAQQEKEVTAKLKNLNSDTVRYFQDEIFSHKQSFVGKPLSVLLAHLPAGIKRYMHGVNERHKQQVVELVINYASQEEGRKRVTQKQMPMVVVVTWKTPLNMDDLRKNGLSTLFGNWDTAIYDYLKDQIIGDISVPGKNNETTSTVVR